MRLAAGGMVGGLLYDNGKRVGEPQINLPQVDIFTTEGTLPEVTVSASDSEDAPFWPIDNSGSGLKLPGGVGDVSLGGGASWSYSLLGNESSTGLGLVYDGLTDFSYGEGRNNTALALHSAEGNTELQNQGGFATQGIDDTDGDPNHIIDPKHPGVYLLEKVRNRWTVTRATDSIETDKAAINGMLNDPGYAAWLMGKHAEAEFGENLSKFTLFYNPTEGFASDAWESLRDKLGMTTDVAEQFAAVLKKTQASGRHVDWVTHSQGAIIYSEAVRVNGGDLSNSSVVFHAGGNNRWVTNDIMERAGVKVVGYKDHPFDPVPNVAGLNTLNPLNLVGSLVALPFVVWGGQNLSPHTMPYVQKEK